MEYKVITIRPDLTKEEREERHQEFLRFMDKMIEKYKTIEEKMSV